MYRFYVDDTSDTEALFLNCMGDFGAAGMPGTFKIFFADVVVGMARAAQVLTLPMPIYVDDCALIGPDRDRVDLEMRVFAPSTPPVLETGDYGGGWSFISSRQVGARDRRQSSSLIWGSPFIVRTGSGCIVLALEHACALSRFAGRLRRSLSLSGPALLLRLRAGGWGRVSSLLWEPGRL